MRRVLVLEAHPDPHSYGTALADAYAEGAAAAGAEVRRIALRDLAFDPILHHGFREAQPWEPDLTQTWEAIQAADHLVFEFPVWWGNLPALLKGFVDRVLLPGVAFRNVDGKPLPVGLLAGRTSRLITTMDSPWWWYSLKHGRAAHRAMTGATLHYVGVARVRETTVYALRTLDARQREQHLERARRAGTADASAGSARRARTHLVEGR